MKQMIFIVLVALLTVSCVDIDPMSVFDSNPLEEDVPGVYLANHGQGVDVLVIDTTGLYTHMGYNKDIGRRVYSDKWSTRISDSHLRLNLDNFCSLYRGSSWERGRIDTSTPMYTRFGEVCIVIDTYRSYRKIGGLNFDTDRLFDSLIIEWKINEH